MSARRRDGERNWSGFPGPADPADAEADRPRSAGADDLHLRPGTLHGRRPRHAGRGRLRHGPLPRGKLQLRDARRRAEPEAAAASATVPVPPPVPETRTYRVEFAKTGRVVECAADTNILTAARAAGMRLPSSCTKGLCGTCKSKLDLRNGGDEARGRHPPARDRRRTGAALLLQAHQRRAWWTGDGEAWEIPRPSAASTFP